MGFLHSQEGEKGYAVKELTDRKAYEERQEKRVIYFAVFLSSMTGAQFFGISLNKIALIPLIFYLLKRTGESWRLNRAQLVLLIWYAASAVSCVLGLVRHNDYAGYSGKILMFLIQIHIFYLPLLMSSWRLAHGPEYLKKAMLSAAKLHAVWAMLQFIMWYGLKVDLNSAVFQGLFRGIFGSEWSAWSFENGTLAIRITGLNDDPAFFVLVLIMGFFLTKSKGWKLFFFAMALFSMSRTGIVVMAAITGLELAAALRVQREGIKSKRLLFIVGGIAAVLIAGIIAYIGIDSVRYQVNYTLFRLSNIVSGKDAGTSRHVNYIPLSMEVWLKEFSILDKLFGVGPRAGGCAFTSSEIANRTIVVFYGTWAIECDYAELLMGHGIFGLTILIPFLMLLRSAPREFRSCLYALLLMGVMYNVMETTYVQLFLLVLLADGQHDQIRGRGRKREALRCLEYSGK